jgi:hypothetical protein
VALAGGLIGSGLLPLCVHCVAACQWQPHWQVRTLRLGVGPQAESESVPVAMSRWHHDPWAPGGQTAAGPPGAAEQGRADSDGLESGGPPRGRPPRRRADISAGAFA